MIKQELLDAYLVAKYIVFFDNKEHRLHIGKRSQEVEQLLTKYNTTSAYFISPENPFSQQLSIEENASRHELFLNYLRESNNTFFLGFGTDEHETWPREKSYLILNNDENEMVGLANSFDQNAILKIELGSVITLIIVN